jgi:hypothetical protein
MSNTKTHFLIDVLTWAEKRPGGFSQDGLMESRVFESWEKEILQLYFATANTNHNRKGLPNYVYLPETIFYVVRTTPEWTYVLTPDALFKYIDYTELKLARQSATEAKKFSQKSISVSERSMSIAVIAIVVSVLMPLLAAWFITQTIKIDEDQIKYFETKFIK